MLSSFFQPFTSHWFLLKQLTQRDIKARYKQSIVGYAWIILNPLSQILVYSFVFSVVFRFPTNNVPYPIFLFAGLLPWIFLQNAITSATNSLVTSSSLLKKVAFPREIIPYAAVVSKIIDFGVASLIFLVMAVVFKAPLSWTAIMVVPLFLCQLILVQGLSLLLAAGNLFFRDVQYLVALLMMLWMYMSPVVYPVSLVPVQYLWLYKLNPMVGLIEGYRSALFGYPFEMAIIWWAVGVSVAIFVVSYVLFKKAEAIFADVV